VCASADRLQLLQWWRTSVSSVGKECMKWKRS